MATFAPVALFVYKRAEMLSGVLDAVERCPEFASSPIFIYSDGPRGPADKAAVEAVRALVRSRLRANMRIIEAPKNLGLATSIIRGVTDICREHGRVIVLEDDLLISPATLTWFNAALDRYEQSDQVMQISGYGFNISSVKRRAEAYFVPIVSSWGWATWERAWVRFDPEARDAQRALEDPRLRRRFNLDGAYPYSKMLARQMKGETDSWAIRWYWTVFKAGGLVLFPPITMVSNRGADRGATHLGFARLLNTAMNSRVALASVHPRFPAEIARDDTAYQAIRRRTRWRLL